MVPACPHLIPYNSGPIPINLGLKKSLWSLGPTGETELCSLEPCPPQITNSAAPRQQLGSACHDPSPMAPPAGLLTDFLTQVELNIVAGYGSPKDVAVYAALGLSPNQTYIVGRAVRKLQAQCQVRPEKAGNRFQVQG